ncbi:MAG: hypothetical protein OEW73_16080, partial [Gammaproteobacteria bacterium]|nr:hypothetical protein [Gammaproteobacteria bacterium]
MGRFRDRLKSMFRWATLLLAASPGVSANTEYNELLQIFSDWRAFESPPLLDGAPDYTVERFELRQPEFLKLRDRLEKLDPKEWPVPEQVDWHLVRAEMNGYDFNRRVLMPWARDPAFYKSIWMERSDVPAHEGPTHHAVVEIWTYEFPLSAKERRRLIKELSVIPPLFTQAKRNLTGNARDLWVTGIRDIRGDARDLDQLRAMIGKSMDDELDAAITSAQAAAVDLGVWLNEQAPGKDGPSGIGKENYTWYQQNVHLVPMTWEDEVRLLKRELDRAWTSLKLEEQRNRQLPPMQAANSPEVYDAMTNKAVDRIMRFL